MRDDTKKIYSRIENVNSAGENFAHQEGLYYTSTWKLCLMGDLNCFMERKAPKCTWYNTSRYPAQYRAENVYKHKSSRYKRPAKRFRARNKQVYGSTHEMIEASEPKNDGVKKENDGAQQTSRTLTRCTRFQRNTSPWNRRCTRKKQNHMGENKHAKENIYGYESEHHSPDSITYWH